MSTQAPSQAREAGGQVQVPPSQAQPSAQGLSQAPQCSESIRGSTQRPSHIWSGGLQRRAQVPPSQSSPRAHDVSQLPQCFGSCSKETHSSPQRSVPSGQSSGDGLCAEQESNKNIQRKPNPCHFSSWLLPASSVRWREEGGRRRTEAPRPGPASVPADGGLLAVELGGRALARLRRRPPAEHQTFRPSREASRS